MLSQDKKIEISLIALSRMGQVGQEGHSISTTLQLAQGTRCHCPEEGVTELIWNNFPFLYQNKCGFSLELLCQDSSSVKYSKWLLHNKSCSQILGAIGGIDTFIPRKSKELLRYSSSNYSERCLSQISVLTDGVVVKRQVFVVMWSVCYPGKF